MPQKRDNERKFHLKPFSLSHGRSTMKVGMDALLFGRWVPAGNARQILDVGTGSGILALLLATRSTGHITALDIDKDSAEEAGCNFNQSPFYHRMEVVCDDFSHYVRYALKDYDLIVSNPPFFVNDQPSATERKRQARHAISLTYTQLLEGSLKLLSPHGRLAVVLPYESGKKFIDLARMDFGFHLKSQQTIFPGRGLAPNRLNLEFSRRPISNVKQDILVLREEDGKFSKEYFEWLRDYLITGQRT